MTTFPHELDRQRTHGVRGFLHDLMSLLELQADLLKADAREGLQRATRPLILALVGAVILATCLPIAFLTAAVALDEWTRLSLAGSLAVVLLIGLAASAAVFAAAYASSRRLSMFHSSRLEWQRNVQWFKKSLQEVHDA